jgi:hypothetical protein
MINNLVKGFFAAALAASLVIPFRAVGETSDCSSRFEHLLRESVGLANVGEYGEAAALREKSGVLFQKCFREGRAPRDEMFPFDGVNAFTVAGTLWHVAGRDDRAHKALKSAVQALHEVLAAVPVPSLNAQQRSYYLRIQSVVDREEGGKWGVWN